MLMAKTSCVNGHPMWNGDGKPVLWIFRTGYFREYEEKHPNTVLAEDGYVPQIYDLCEDAYKEELDGWYCDECKSVAVFCENTRYDYVLKEKLPEYSYDQTEDWEEYIALRDDDFEDFQEFYEKKKPFDAIQSYRFKYTYRLSPDEKIILAFDQDKKPAFAYELKRFIDFDKQNEEKEEETENGPPFDIEKFCRMAEEEAMQMLGVSLDYSRSSIHLLDEMVLRIRSMYKKKLIDDTVLWNLAVTLGTYYGEVMLKDLLAERGLSWDDSEHPPVLADKGKGTIIKPIDTVHHAMFVSEASANNYLWSDYGNIRLLADMYLSK